MSESLRQPTNPNTRSRTRTRPRRGSGALRHNRISIHDPYTRQVHAAITRILARPGHASRCRTPCQSSACSSNACKKTSKRSKRSNPSRRLGYTSVHDELSMHSLRGVYAFILRCRCVHYELYMCQSRCIFIWSLRARFICAQEVHGCGRILSR